MNRLSQREIVHEGNVINNLSERGNTASTSHFVALWDNIHTGRVRSGDRVLFAVQGSGMTIGTAGYTLDDLPDRVRRAASNGHKRPATASQERTRAILRCEAPRVRIESVGIANGCGPTSGMALVQRAMDDCFAASSYSKDDIDLLMYTGVNRDDFIGEPAIAALIAGRSRMNETGGFPVPGKKTFAFDVYNGSMGFLNACYLGAGMIRAGRVKSVMIVASEIEPNGASGMGPMGVAAAGSAVILDSPADGPAGIGSLCVRVVHRSYWSVCLVARHERGDSEGARHEACGPRSHLPEVHPADGGGAPEVRALADGGYQGDPAATDLEGASLLGWLTRCMSRPAGSSMWPWTAAACRPRR